MTKPTSNTSPSFDLLDDHLPVASSSTLPAFLVSLTRGFLPRVDPPATLPPAFTPLESILQRMPLLTSSGTPGLLASGALARTVLAELPDLTVEVEKVRHDLPLVGALYRDYSFLASAYLLEPCHLRHAKGEGYGLGRQSLPAVIARPLAMGAEIAGFAPFIEYAGAYALYNYRLEDPAKGMEYDNLRMIRAFEHGVADTKSSEAGFVLVHVDMVKHSGPLVRGAVQALEACEADDREAFDDGLRDVIGAMEKINRVMNDMWRKSKPNEYTNFRTFIFGITKQSMFPHGVVYEGVSEEPKDFRGESGANDSMIPLCDNLLQVTMPETPLTEILKDFRSYRPGNHRDFLEWVKHRSNALDLKEFAMQAASSAALYLRALDQVRDFRWRHWCFTREYILKQTSHPTATGGSPIVTWLPNQLQAVLDAMAEVAARFEGGGDRGGLRGCEEVIGAAAAQQVALRKEVAKYCKERKVGGH